jgi:hypothetical protein
MNKYISPNVKLQLVSASQTFVSSFLVILGTSASSIDFNNLDNAALIASIYALIFAAGRAALKAVWIKVLEPKA